MLPHKRRQTVNGLNRLGDDADLTGPQARTIGRDCNCASRTGGTDGYAVDAAFGIQVEVVCGIDLAAIVAAAPDARSRDGEIHSGVISRAAPTLGVDDLHVN